MKGGIEYHIEGKQLEAVVTSGNTEPKDTVITMLTKYAIHFNFKLAQTFPV